jgi:hypothetical protein
MRPKTSVTSLSFMLIVVSSRSFLRARPEINRKTGRQEGQRKEFFEFFLPGLPVFL